MAGNMLFSDTRFPKIIKQKVRIVIYIVVRKAATVEKSDEIFWAILK